MANRVVASPISSGSAFERLESLRRSERRLIVRPAEEVEVEALYRAAEKSIGRLGALSDVHRIWRHNPLSLWVFFRQDRLIGGIAPLPLNDRGHAALLCGAFDSASPDIEHVARPAEFPSAFYVWALLARGRGFLAIWDVLSAVMDRDRSLPVFTRVATGDGLRAACDYGFAPLTDVPGLRLLRIRQADA